MKLTGAQMVEFFKIILPYLKPKAYNTITRLVVVAGLLLCADAAFGVTDYVLIWLAEILANAGDYMKALLKDSNYNPIIGLILVGMGLIYHAFVTVGLNATEGAKQERTLPEFKFDFLDQDGNVWDRDIQSRGRLLRCHKTDLPDYEPPRYNGPLGMHSIQPFNKRTNRDLFRERAKILNTWSGAEILTLQIKNVGTAIARNVNVEIHIERSSCCITDNIREFLPEIPQPETDILDISSIHRDEPDIKRKETRFENVFEWFVGDVQAQRTISSKMHLFVRTTEIVEMQCYIYCDEMAKPILKRYRVLPCDKEERQFDDATLFQRDNFVRTLDAAFMDGFMLRYLREEYVPDE